MPIIRGSASDVTTFRRLNANILRDPTIKSSSYTPNQSHLLDSLRTSAVGSRINPAQTILATANWSRYANPRHQGYVQDSLPRPTPPAPFDPSLYFQVDFGGRTLLNTQSLSVEGIVSPSGSITELEFILTNLVRYDLLTNVEIFRVQYGENIDFTTEQYAAITLSAQPQIGTRISNQDTFDYAPYQFSAGSYTPSVVFTVTFPVPVDIFDLAAATY